MPNTTAPSRAELEESTEQALAWLRDPANEMEGPAGEFYRSVSGEVAGELLAEFPFTFPLGRVVMAVAQALASAQEGIESQTGEPVSAEILHSIAFLAAEKLDRDEGDRG